MLDFFKKPIAIIFVFIAIIVALIWSYVDNYLQNKKIQNDSAIVEETSIANLTNVDAGEFDQTIKEEYATANAKALEVDPKHLLAAIVVELPGLDINSGNSRYVFISESDPLNNWVITISQLTSNYIRSEIPKEDYLGELSSMNTSLWKFNYVTAIQMAEENGGLAWRENSTLTAVTVTLKHGNPSNWLTWTVEYTGPSDSFEIKIDANSGQLIE